MQIVRDLPSLRTARAALEGRVAFVPTMGALHAGHLHLIEEAKRHADHVVASIFVNPTQFGPNEDLSRYPRQEAQDAALLREAGVAWLWAPDAAVMYPQGFATTISVKGLSERWCGASRPGHFDGVATVVAKLFGQVRPDVALFGEKDWQQLAVIRRMTVDLDLVVDIVGVPTVRDADGLALSSRNAYLTPEQRDVAVAFPNALRRAAQAIAEGADLSQAIAAATSAIHAAGFRVDYVAAVDENLAPALANPHRILAAAWLGATRLIDNFPIDFP